MSVSEQNPAALGEERDARDEHKGSPFRPARMRLAGYSGVEEAFERRLWYTEGPPTHCQAREPGIFGTSAETSLGKLAADD